MNLVVLNEDDVSKGDNIFCAFWEGKVILTNETNKDRQWTCSKPSEEDLFYPCIAIQGTATIAIL
jgi:hypothetical protein